MPYIIAVLVLVVVGVGFTLTKTSPLETGALTNNDPTIAELQDRIATELVETSGKLEETEMVILAEAPNTEAAPEPLPESDTGPAPEPTPAPTLAPTPVVVAPEPEPVIIETTPPAPVVTTPPPISPAYDFVNGTYSTNVSYRTPDGNYAMDVSLTVSNDTVTAADVTFSSKAARDSYSRRFDKAYSSYVVGEDLGALDLSRVGGASLTTRAFNKAIDQIQTQAQV